MASLRDLSRKGALDVLAALYRAHPKPFDAMAFAAASGMAPNNAIKLRADLEGMHLISAEIVREQGAIKEWEIRLTPAGREVAAHFAAVDDFLSAQSEQGSVKVNTKGGKRA